MSAKVSMFSSMTPRRSRLDPAVTVLLVLIVSNLTGVALQPVTSAGLEVGVSSGNPRAGRALTIRGQGFPGGGTGKVVWVSRIRNPGGADSGVSGSRREAPLRLEVPGAVMTDAQGRLTSVVNVPVLQPGAYDLSVVVGDIAARTTVRLRAARAGTVATTTPAVSVNPQTGVVGALISMRGTGFPARQRGSVYWAGSTTGMPRIRTGRVGAFKTSLVVPNVPAGQYAVTVVVGGISAAATVTVQAAPSPTPTTTPSPTLTPQPTATPSPTSTPFSGRRVVGYFPIWNSNAGYTVSDIDFTVVTHVAHFAVVPRGDGTIAIPDWGRFPDANLVTTAHANGAKVVLVVGGDHAEATRGFSTMAASPRARERFVAELVNLLDRQGYDGVDLDWEFPQSDADRANLTALVRGLRLALGDGRTLSMAGAGSDWYGRWYDIPALMPNLDWFASMTYVFAAASWSATSGHNSALYGSLAVDAARQYYLSRGVPESKLLVGIPFYGERFDSVSGLGEQLTSTSGGAMAYPEIEPLAGNGWTLLRDDPAGAMPYLVRQGSPGVIVFDDATSIREKCSYVVGRGLGGVIIWHLGQDRIGGNQSLLSAVRGCR